MVLLASHSSFSKNTAVLMAAAGKSVTMCKASSIAAMRRHLTHHEQQHIQQGALQKMQRLWP